MYICRCMYVFATVMYVSLFTYVYTCFPNNICMCVCTYIRKYICFVEALFLMFILLYLRMLVRLSGM